jgi:hypothetical protein
MLLFLRVRPVKVWSDALQRRLYPYDTGRHARDDRDEDENTRSPQNITTRHVSLRGL